MVVEAPAKLTLSLVVTGTSPDGLHTLEAEMVALTFADELTFGDGDGLEVVDETGQFGLEPGVQPSPAGTREGMVPVGGDNLVRRALAAVGRRAMVRLVKRIPAGAGLGGGSSDAAAVLRWAGAVPHDPSDPQQPAVRLALALGSDVPFCVVGGRALVSGRGEVVRPLPFRPARFLLVTPPLVSPTDAVYAAWDALGGPRGTGGNDLEQAALAVTPPLAQWRDAFAERCGTRPRLAGSGSTWFAEVRSDAQEATAAPLEVGGQSAAVRLASALPAFTCPPGAASASP